ncbi:hypothetical protein QJQ45_021965, partial [Haematococcus lacustris]
HTFQIKTPLPAQLKFIVYSDVAEWTSLRSGCTSSAVRDCIRLPTTEVRAGNAGNAANATATPSNMSNTRLSLLASLVVLPLGYGGRKQLEAMDAGSGNKEYDDLMAKVKARRQAATTAAAASAPSPVQAPAPAPTETKSEEK